MDMTGSKNVIYSRFSMEGVEETIVEMLDVKEWKKSKQIFTCRRCFVEFRTKKLLTKHRKEVHFREIDEKKYNYTYNAKEESYTCNTCDSESKTLEEIEAHVLSHEETFNCPTCGESFKSPYKFSVHEQRHNEDGFYKCPMCSYKTLRVSSILQHINLRHLRKHLYNCSFCGKGFQDRLTFVEHENIHLGVAPFFCVVCGREFNFSKNLLKHQVTHHTVNIEAVSQNFQCTTCNKCFNKSISLKKHKKRHERNGPKEKIHLCDNCGKGFATKSKLTEHYRVHTGVKPYECGYCDKRFTKRDYLVQHERIHSGVKPYSCAYCGKRFNQDASYRIHVRIHTGERPYICHICQGGFVSKATMKTHQKNCAG